MPRGSAGSKPRQRGRPPPENDHADRRRQDHERDEWVVVKPRVRKERPDRAQNKGRPKRAPANSETGIGISLPTEFFADRPEKKPRKKNNASPGAMCGNGSALPVNRKTPNSRTQTVGMNRMAVRYQPEEDRRRYDKRASAHIAPYAGADVHHVWPWVTASRSVSQP